MLRQYQVKKKAEEKRLTFDLIEKITGMYLFQRSMWYKNAGFFFHSVLWAVCHCKFIKKISRGNLFILEWCICLFSFPSEHTCDMYC